MVALLVIDIGLAAAGGVLMSKGLAERKAPTESVPVEKKSEAATASVDKVAASVPVPAVVLSATPTAPSNIAARESPKRDATKPSPPATTPATKPTSATKPTATKPPTLATQPATKPEPVADKPEPAKPVTSVPAQPQDPDPEREIDAAAARSKAAFAGCATDHPGHGAINIAFQVSADGRVINAAAVENTTGNADLARCLIAEISSWRVSAHSGAPTSLVRLFTYP